MRVRLIALIMVIIIILSVIYVFYGKNWLAEQSYLQKKRNEEFVRNELMEKFLEIQQQSQDVLNEIAQLNSEIKFFPAQKFKLEKEWSKELNLNITNKPCFDYKNIYLISDNKIIALNKNLEIIKWEYEFTDQINDMELLDANRILVATVNGGIFCLNRSIGNIIWHKEDCPVFEKKGIDSYIYQLSLDKYKKLDSSVIMMYTTDSLRLISNIDGQELGAYETDHNISYISEFDIMGKCIYLVEGNRVVKVNIKVEV